MENKEVKSIAIVPKNNQLLVQEIPPEKFSPQSEIELLDGTKERMEAQENDNLVRATVLEVAKCITEVSSFDEAGMLIKEQYKKGDIVIFSNNWGVSIRRGRSGMPLLWFVNYDKILGEIVEAVEAEEVEELPS